MRGAKETNAPMPMLPDELLLNNDLFFIEVARMLSQGRSVTLQTKGKSMYPFITGGRDIVELRKTDTLSVGDIVLAEVPGRGYVLHRIYKMEGEQLVLMGDGNLRATERCRKEDVLGKVVRILRDGRYVESSSFAERFKARCWRRLLPLRRYLLFVCRLCKKIGVSCHLYE